MQVLEDVGGVVSEVGVSVGEQTGRILDILDLLSLSGTSEKM